MASVNPHHSAADAVELLIKTSREAARIYRNAAIAADDPELRTLTSELSESHDAYRRELQRLGSFPGAAIRREGIEAHLIGFWLDLTPAFAHADDSTLAVGCLRFNDRCGEAYAMAFENPALPPAARSVVSVQLREVLEASRRLRAVVAELEFVAA